MRIYPAYAQTLARHLMRGNRPACIGVLLSSRWAYFDRAPRICVKPDEWALGRFEFGYLRNEHAVAIWGDETTEPQFGELLIDLMAAGPRLVWAVACTGEWIYKDSFDVGLARYAEELAGRRHAQTIQLALHAYGAGQARDLEAVVAAAEKATEHGRTRVAWLDQRNAGLQMAELLFANPHAEIDERTA